MTLPRAALLLLLSGNLAAQAPAPALSPAPGPDPEAGFVAIFNGTSLEGWDGDPKYWRVEDGCLVGEITPETIVKRNTFIIWRGGEPRDFELKLEYRVSDRGNSGINYRSTQLTDAGWSLRGYQADLDGQNRYNGQNYEERGRTFLAMRGQIARLAPGQKPAVLGSLGGADDLKAVFKPGEWNEYHLVIRGNLLIHILNGRALSIVIDEDPANARADGLLGVQVHVGPPMKVEYRNIRLKTL
jgi:hypothetical protein